MFAHLERVPSARWDDLHDVNHAVQTALDGASWVVALFDLLFRIRCAFGSGQGLAMAEGIVESLAERDASVKFVAPRSPCSTRTAVYLAGVPERLLGNLRWLIHACGMRARHRQLCRGRHSIEHYRQIAKDTADFLMLLRSMAL